MLRIDTHIERLLQIHDCVIVPDLGGFVLQTVPAFHSEVEGVFHPMRKEIVFNSTLCHNDGLLIESYMKIYTVDYRTARLMVEEDVKALQTALREEKQVRLARIGILKSGEEGLISFRSVENSFINPETYCLPTFHFKPLSSLPSAEEILYPEEKRVSRKDTIYIPVSKKLLKGVSATAAALALFLIVSTPVKDMDKSSYTASFIPISLIQENEYSFPVIDVIQTEELIPEEIVVAAEPEVIEKITAKPVVSNKKMYHIVIGSLVTDKQADDFMAKIDKSLYPGVGSITRDGKIRVFADKFDNREDAEAYLEKLRSGQTYQDAWLFISR